MKVDLTKEQIEACIDALCDVPHSDRATRDALGLLQLALENNQAEEFAELSKRVEVLERWRDNLENTQFNRDAERAWRGE